MFRKKRYLVYLIITFVVGLVPFIRINGNQIFLISFDRKEIHLLGRVFEAQDFYLMPFLLILFFVGIFFLTNMFGRIWCGWGCPQTIFRVLYRDLIEGKILGLNKINNKQKPQDLSSLKNKLKKLLGVLIVGVLCFFASANLLFYFVPPLDFINYVSDYQNHQILFWFWIALGLFFLMDIVIFKENFCIYVCPYSRVQSVLFDDHTKSVFYDQSRGGVIWSEGSKVDNAKECILCQKCVKVCPTHIDIRAGMQLECINCLECVDACKSVLGEDKTLVEWRNSSGAGLIRTKTIAYFCVMLLAFGALVFSGSNTKKLHLNISRGTESSLLTSGYVKNEYVLLLQNGYEKEQEFYFEIIGGDFEILRPKKSITIKPHKKQKIILVLSHKMASSGANPIIPIIIKATSTQDKNISVEEKSVFIYPSS